MHGLRVGACRCQCPPQASGPQHLTAVRGVPMQQLQQPSRRSRCGQQPLAARRNYAAGAGVARPALQCALRHGNIPTGTVGHPRSLLQLAWPRAVHSDAVRLQALGDFRRSEGAVPLERAWARIPEVSQGLELLNDQLAKAVEARLNELENLPSPGLRQAVPQLGPASIKNLRHQSCRRLKLSTPLPLGALLLGRARAPAAAFPRHGVVVLLSRGRRGGPGRGPRCRLLLFGEGPQGRNGQGV
mmetsp:Transcript_20862/g.58100  ORF Transcript_20862/g.58100 Transcript_20862/m.58100 type:complete len:243 (-) Transcript_20862:308-1036(-)